MQAFSSVPFLSLHASRMRARLAMRSLTFASHFAGSLVCEHISWRMQSRSSLPFLPSQALRALACAALAFSTRSSQALGSLVLEQSKRRSRGWEDGGVACAKRAVLAVSRATETRVLSMEGPFVGGGLLP